MVKEKGNKEENLMGIFQHPFIENDVEEVLEKEIKSFGNGSAHITGMDKRHIGKVARVVIKKQMWEELIEKTRGRIKQSIKEEESQS